jgi:hypothetical protein
MRRRLTVCGAAIGAALSLLAGSASAQVIELGATKTAVTAPSCPANVPPAQCTIILTRATALETLRDGTAYPTTAKKAGKIVAFTVGLSSLSASPTTRLTDIRFLDSQYGGTTQIAVTVLRRTGAKKLQQWKVIASSPLFHVQPFLGQVVQFALDTTLPVQAGDVVALTTPTWAPVLSINQPASQFSYRQSRNTNCKNPPATSQAQLRPGTTGSYLCNYPGTRVEYTATEVTTPPTPKHYVRTARRAVTRRSASQHH